MLRKVINSKTKNSRIKNNSLRDVALVILSAVLLALPFNNGNLWVFAWFGFVPLFFVLENKSSAQAFMFSFLSGVIFWFFTIYWLANVTIIGFIVFILYLGLYFGLFGVLIRRFYFPLLFAPSLWVVLEYIRSFLLTGFPWALLGYSQYKNLPAIQIADITGVWGVSFLVIIVNVYIYRLIRNRPRLQQAVIVPVIVLVSFGYGFYKINLAHSRISLSQLRISVVQANIPQELKWDPKAKHYIMENYIRLTETVSKERPDLIIWPEAASPCYLGEEKWCFNEISDLSYRIHRPLLLGTVTVDRGSYYNSVLFINGLSQEYQLYHKIHLVPFGEYIPLRHIFTFLDTVVPIGDFSAGKEYIVFNIPDPASRTKDKFSVLICFEDVFPGLARNFVKNGAQFLVNITNDAWFGRTSSPYQHLSASVSRAVENRVSLVRSANTGVSAFISPEGRIEAIFSDDKGRNIFVEGALTRELKVFAAGKAFYTRFGDIFIFLLFIFLIYSIFRLFYIAKERK